MKIKGLKTVLSLPGMIKGWLGQRPSASPEIYSHLVAIFNKNVHSMLDSLVKILILLLESKKDRYLSYYLKGYKTVIDNFEQYLQLYDLIEISMITYYEIVGGLLAKNALKQLNVYEDFVLDNLVVPMAEHSAKISAELYSTPRQSGNSVFGRIEGW